MLAKNTCGEIGAFVHRWQECKTVLLLWKTAWGVPQKLNLGYHLFQQFHPGCTPERSESMGLYRYLYPRVQSSVIQNSQKLKATQGSTNRCWISKTWSLHTMEHHSALKKEMLTPATVRLHPEDRVLRETRQTLDRRCAAPPTRGP